MTPVSYPVLLSAAQWAVIERALGELPAKIANPIMADVNRQMREAHAAAQALSEKPETPSG